MHLIAPLAAGMGGAASGTARIYNRGTSTRATYYTSFEGAGATTPSADVALDSNGRLIAYVDTIVDVTVYSSAGAAVAAFTAGDAVSGLEVRSASFTGTHYDTAASAAGNPTTLQSVINLWKTNAGNTSAAIDWKVLVDGVSTSLYSALGRFTGPVIYNVKDPAYGAVGDNSNDDTAEIQAAIDAATAATYGGVVYFPPGIYRVSSTLTVNADVSLIGAGANVCTLRMNHASADLISIGGADNGQVVSGFTLDTAQAHSGNMLSVAASSKLNVANCYIGGASDVNGDLVEIATSASAIVRFYNCYFEWSGATTGAVNMLGAADRVTIAKCHFQPPATCNATNGVIYGRNIDIDGCLFRTDLTTAGTYSCYKANSTTLNATVSGCTFNTSGGATVTGIQLGTYIAASKFMETGNNAPGFEDTAFTLYSYTTTVAQGAADVRLHTRELRDYYVESNAATVTVDAKQYGYAKIVATGTTLATVTVSGNAPIGAKFVLVYEGAGTTSITFNQSVEAGTLDLPGITDQVITNNFLCSCLYVSERNDTPTGYWMAVGAARNNVAF